MLSYTPYQVATLGVKPLKKPEKNIKDAIGAYIRVLISDNEKIPTLFFYLKTCPIQVFNNGLTSILYFL